MRAGIGRGERVELAPGVDLVNGRNRGVAFGLLGEGGALVTVLAAVALVVLVAFFFTHARRPLVWLPVGLLLGGALGNLLDRLREGSVTDFIDVGPWPTFNLADAGITVGVVVLLWVLERGSRRERAPARA